MSYQSFQNRLVLAAILVGGIAPMLYALTSNIALGFVVGLFWLGTFIGSPYLILSGLILAAHQAREKQPKLIALNLAGVLLGIAIFPVFYFLYVWSLQQGLQSAREALNQILARSLGY